MQLDGRKVLVSQQEFVVAADLQRVLETFGAQVIVGDPTHLSSAAWDCAVFDTLRVQQSLAFLEQHKLPIVVYTGSTTPVYDRAVRVIKPATDEELVEAVTRAIENRR